MRLKSNKKEQRSPNRILNPYSPAITDTFSSYPSIINIGSYKYIKTQKIAPTIANVNNPFLTWSTNKISESIPKALEANDPNP